MKSQIEQLVEDAKAWLETQPPPDPGTIHFCTFNNFKAFISTIESDFSTNSIAKACWILGYHITDRYEWSDDYCKPISNFLDRARYIEKARNKMK